MKITEKTIERRYKDEMLLATPKEVVEHFPIFENFFKNMNWWKNKAVCLRFADKENKYGEKGRYRILFYTDFYTFGIDVANNDKHKNPYIGGFYSNRREEPLEDWTRGNDLTDGYDGEKTLNTILLEMLSVSSIGIDVDRYTKDNTFEKSWER